MTNDQRRSAYLEEIGIGPLWKRRFPPSETTGVSEPVVEQLPGIPTHQEAFLAEPAVPGTSMAPAAETHAFSKYDPAVIARMDWATLKETVSGCTKCDLCQSRTHTAFGVGDEKAKWLFVGEGPGRNEDLRGEPFVGQAGKLLDNMLLALGLKRGENAYIANIVKCRPTDAAGKDRPPTAEESAACIPYLQRQISLIQPAIIVALGKTAALSLLNLRPDTPVSKLRGTVHTYADRPLVVTYHPAYLLRNLADKKKAWEDLCLAMATYGR
ncbi:uracil-DNA glycosylase [Noviherbaspirillum sp.]|uniref:uracil-DNA glycosylase n=1 Tax=Noviherbaspirillum sp. TaxID=1926288 RepID=UPI002FDFC9C2